MRRTMTTVAVLALVLAPATAVRAESPADRVHRISDRLHGLWMAGVPDAVRFADVEREFGIDILTAPQDVEPMATNNEVVEVGRATVWYDSYAKYPYGASASFRWKYTCGKNKDEACWLEYGAGSGQGPVGGDDGFALKIDTPVKTAGSRLTLNPNCNDKDLIYNQPTDKSEYGIGYHKPDPVDHDPRHCTDRDDHREYSWDSGSISTGFAVAEPCKRPRLFVATKFGHTWEKTNITGFGIGADSISIQWEREGHNFDAFHDEDGFYDCHY